MDNVLDVLHELNVTHLVTIGGDDTAYSGSQVYLRAGGAIRVAHVPKTIDNDLPLPGSTPTFGFETARQLGVQHRPQPGRGRPDHLALVSDRQHGPGGWPSGPGHRQGRGRHADHHPRGVPRPARAPWTSSATSSWSARSSSGGPGGRHYGVAVLAEGLIEAIGEQGLPQMDRHGQLGRYGKVERDPHGHLRLGEIEFGRMVKDRLSTRLEELGLTVTLIDKDLGYELRCADPIPFDAEYTRDLGYGAVKFLRSAAAAKYRRDHQLRSAAAWNRCRSRR